MIDGFVLSCDECGLYESYEEAVPLINHSVSHNTHCPGTADIRRAEFYD